MKINKFYIKNLIKQSLKESFMLPSLLPFLFYTTAKKNKEFKQLDPEVAGALSIAGFDQAIQQNLGTIGDFVEYKVEASIGPNSFYSTNTLDKYFHSLAFCIATMEMTIESCRKFVYFRGYMAKEYPDNESVQDMMKPTREVIIKEISEQVKEVLRSAGAWKESFFDHTLGYGSSDIQDLQANEFGMSVAFDDNWREKIYEKYVPVLKPVFYKAFVSPNEEYISKKTGKKVEPHFRYALGSDSPYYKEELKKAAAGEDFKFIAPPYNIAVSQEDREHFRFEESLSHKTGGFKYPLDLKKMKKFNKYVSFDYIKKLYQVL